MSRCLAPPRIGLLALISLYTESAVPAAATIPVLTFLTSHLLSIPLSAEQPIKTQQDFVIPIEAFQAATSPLASAIPGRTVWDLLLNRLWRIDSLDSLHRFFDDLSLLLVQVPEGELDGADDRNDPVPNRILLSRVSPLGAFVRRTQLEFTRLQFHDAVALWKKLVQYRAGTLSQWKKRNPSAEGCDFDINLDDNTPNRLVNLIYNRNSDVPHVDVNATTADLERLLEYQMALMRRKQRLLNLPLEAFELKKFQEVLVLRRFQHFLTTFSKAYYLSYMQRDLVHKQYRFLDSWRAGDYSTAFDSLHRYYDYTIYNRDRASLQYALLDMALLHADFGCYPEALTAIQETIATARENNDLACLNYCLSWLYHCGKAHPTLMEEIRKKGLLGPDEETVNFLKSKARASKMWDLLGKSHISEVKLLSSHGEDISRAFENVLKASHLSLLQNRTSAMGGQMMVRMTLFGRLGVNCQATLILDILHHCYSLHSSIEDDVSARCTAALSLALKGRFTEAFANMESIDRNNLRDIRHRAHWIFHMGILKLRQHILRNQLVAAENVLAQLKAQNALSREAQFRLTQLEIEICMRRKSFPLALELLEKLASNEHLGDVDIWHRIKVMTMKAHICDAAGVPQKGFSVALRAASLAWKSKVLTLLWEAIIELCAIFNSVEEFDAVIHLLESIMPHTLEWEDCEMTGRMFSVLADAHVGMAGQAETGSAARKEQVSKGLECLGRAFDQLSQLGDITGQCEMLAKRATLMHVNGDPVLANECAAKYLAIKKAAKDIA